MNCTGRRRKRREILYRDVDEFLIQREDRDMALCYKKYISQESVISH